MTAAHKSSRVRPERKDDKEKGMDGLYGNSGFGVIRET